MPWPRLHEDRVQPYAGSETRQQPRQRTIMPSPSQGFVNLYEMSCRRRNQSSTGSHGWPAKQVSKTTPETQADLLAKPSWSYVRSLLSYHPASCFLVSAKQDIRSTGGRARAAAHGRRIRLAATGPARIDLDGLAICNYRLHQVGLAENKAEDAKGEE